jgi:amino-acid N-acetyltransferase
MSDGQVRRARVGDVVGMQRLVNRFAERGEMLPRALHQLYEDIRDFHVIEDEDEIVACAALHVNWANLAEVKSVAVAEHRQRRGYGAKVVQACVVDARALGVAELYCLTYQPEFFRALGFSEVERGTLPRKVWSECVRCPKFTECTEIPMTLRVLDEETPAPKDPLVSLAALPKRR